MIRIISGKNAKTFPIGNFYSTIAAYEHIFFDEKISAQRQILSRCNLNDYVEPNLIYDKERSEAERTDLLSSIPLASGMVMSGQKIIDRGEVINDYTYRVLTSFDKETKRRSSTEDELTTTIISQAPPGTQSPSAPARGPSAEGPAAAGRSLAPPAAERTAPRR